MSDERIAQLERALAEANERQAAANEVLEVIGRTEFELEPVFETVLRQAVRLCGADAGLIYVLDDDVYRLAFAIGGSQAYRDYIAGLPIARGPGTLVGRVGLERRTVQILDVLADPDYELHRARELGGFRTMLGVPMLAGEGSSASSPCGARRSRPSASARWNSSPPSPPRARSRSRTSSSSASSRSRAGTSRSSWPACRTSCARR